MMTQQTGQPSKSAKKADEDQPVPGFQLLFAVAIVYCLIGTVTVRYIRGVKS